LFFNHELNRCKEEVLSLRAKFYHTFDASWNQLMSNGKITDDKLSEVSSISRKLVHACWKSAATLFPYCGLEAAKKESEINRVWRDIHTASQHALLTFEI
jgi:hypothetical protein